MSSDQLRLRSRGQTSKLEQSSFQRSITPGSSWPDKESFFEVIHWFRQFLGLLIGVVWGIIPLEGAAGLFGFAVVNAAITLLYATKFLRVDVEELGSTTSELLQEGFMSSFGIFLVSWIFFYNAIHYS
eukprot:TRINITY_DN27265_c0_g1_i1.p2 TRINITY_DN27265_c0_g1~~TRINITY_DN27265_c0_g1_i1.p2  ORF type:complete len:128 (-),score=8.20 TRINITY_DN27265_c0_g1_i1:727-1110(-)